LLSRYIIKTCSQEGSTGAGKGSNRRKSVDQKTVGKPPGASTTGRFGERTRSAQKKKTQRKGGEVREKRIDH